MKLTYTYDIVDPDRQTDGEPHEHGFWQPGGWFYAISSAGPAIDLEDIALFEPGLRVVARSRYESNTHGTVVEVWERLYVRIDHDSQIDGPLDGPDVDYTWTLTEEPLGYAPPPFQTDMETRWEAWHTARGTDPDTPMGGLSWSPFLAEVYPELGDEVDLDDIDQEERAEFMLEHDLRLADDHTGTAVAQVMALLDALRELPGDGETIREENTFSSYAGINEFDTEGEAVTGRASYTLHVDGAEPGVCDAAWEIFTR